MAAGLSRGVQRRPEFKLLIPFVRTPVNLLKFAAERSPLAPLMKSWQADVRAGGARRDLALSRMMVGTGFGAAMYEMAANGDITGGGPANDNARRLLLANGWQPYSLKVGDKYYSYARLDPFSTTIGTVADMVDLSSHMNEKEQEQSLSLVAASILSNLSNKTWLSGISSALEAVSDPDRYLDGFLARTVGAVAVPSIVNQAVRVTDPLMREARTPIDRIRSRVPGLSNDLFPRRDVFGQPIKQQEAIGPNIVSPLWMGTGRNDPTIGALLASGVNVSKPQRTYTAGGKRVEWTPGQYDELQALVGKAAKPDLDSLVASPVWEWMDEEARQDEVSEVMKNARTSAKGQILQALSGNPAASAKTSPVAAALAGSR